MDALLDAMAAGLYSLASMLVGEGEDSVRLVETAVATAEVSACHDAVEGRRNSRRALVAAGLELLARREPGGLAAPEGIEPAGSCIEDDDLEAAGVSLSRTGANDCRAGPGPGTYMAGEFAGSGS